MIRKIQAKWHLFWRDHHSERAVFFTRIAMHHHKIADRHSVNLYDKTKLATHSQMTGRGKRSVTIINTNPKKRQLEKT